MKRLVILVIMLGMFISFGNTSNEIKIKDVCAWHHKEIIGWHKNYLLFKKRHVDVSDKTKYPNLDNKTIEKKFLKQKKLIEAIDKAQKQLQVLSKVYHYLECTRFEKKFEKSK